MFTSTQCQTALGFRDILHGAPPVITDTTRLRFPPRGGTRLISLICLIRAMGHAECVLRYF
jgi:hypothetical protein